MTTKWKIESTPFQQEGDSVTWTAEVNVESSVLSGEKPVRKDSVSHSRQVLNTVKFRHRTWNSGRRIAYLFNGYRSFRFAGSMFQRPASQHTELYTGGRGERREERKDHEHMHEGVLLHSHVNLAKAVRLSHISTSQGGGKSCCSHSSCGSCPQASSSSLC